MGNPEPWLRGPMQGVHPLVMPVFFSFAQVREDLAKYTRGLTGEQVWRQLEGTSLGFHLKHMAGSIDRLTTYLAEGTLSAEKVDELGRENVPEADLSELLRAVEESLRACEAKLSGIDPDSIYEARQVGRKALPTTVLGLLVHLAEHTQRHLGQAITLAKMVRQSG